VTVRYTLDMYKKRFGRVSPNTRTRVVQAEAGIVMLIWTVSIGALGGLLYGLMSDSKHIWPKLINVGRRRPLPRVGLIGNAVIGMAAGGLLTTTALGSDSTSFSGSGLTWSSAGVQLLCSFIASSAISGYTERRFLRLAMRNAAMAPAADPATVRALEAATPYEAYIAAERLAPPPARIWGIGSERPRAAHDFSSSARASIDVKTRLAARLVRIPTEVGKRH
jgi:hypothetical protein